MKTRNNPWLLSGLLAASIIFTLSQASHAQSVWTGSTDSVLSNGANYSPSIASTTAAGLNIQFNGTDATTEDLTLATAMGGGTGTGGSSIAVLAGQTNALTITGTAGSIRLTTTGFTVASGAGAVTFAGTGGFTIGGAAGNSTHTVSNASANLLDLGVWSFGPGGGGTRTVSIGGSGNIQSNGNWSGATILNKTGAGTLTLGGATTRTGTTTITDGVLKLTNALALQSSPLVTSGAGTMTLDGITTLTLGGLSGSANLSSVITTGYSGLTELTLNPGSGTQTYSGTIANGAAGMNLVKSGAGTQVLSGASSYTGTTSVNGGTLRLSGSIGGAVSIAATGGIAGEGSIGTGGSLTFADGSTLTADGKSAAALAVGGNLTFGTTTNVILETVPATTGTTTSFRLLDYTGTLAGSGTAFVLQNAASYRGYSFATAFATPNQVNMTIDTKSLVWSGGTADWDITTSTNWGSGAEKFYQGDAVTFNDSGTTKAVTLAVSVLPASVLFDNTTGNDYSLTGTGAIAGSAALTKSNTGTVTLSTPNTYSGGTTLSGGKIIATVAGALGTGVVTNNATLDLTAGAVTYTGLSTSMTGNGIVNVTLPTGSNTVALNGDYSGFTGTINIGVGAAAGAGKTQMTGADNADADINLLSNGTLYVNAAVTKYATVTLNGGDTGESQGQLRLEAGATWAGNVILAGDMAAGDFTVGSNSNGANITGNISETGTPRALSKGGASTVQLSGSNSYTGPTTVSAGSLKLGSAGALGSSTVKTSGVTVNGTAIFDLFGQTPTAVVPLTLNSTANGSDVGSLNNSALGTTATYGGAVTLQAATVMVGGGFTSPGGSITLTGAITGNGVNLNKNGLGALTLSNSGTVTLGKLQANRGVIQVESGTQLNVTSLDIGTGGSVGGNLTLNGGGVTSSGQSRFGQGTGSASGTLTLNGGTLTVPALTKGSLTFNANFNGGTLKASAATTAFFDAATSAKVQAGGAFINDGGFAITIGQPLIHDSALLTADGGLTKSGAGTLVLAGDNTYNGNTTVSAGTLDLAATTGGLKFVPAANGVTNKVTGTGTANFKGVFNIDLTGAAVANGNSWTLVEVATLNETFDASFQVAGFTETANVWKKTDGANTWTFTEATGALSLSVAGAGYSNWLTLYPGILDPAAGADPDNDGLKNVLEYVLNGNPTISDLSILPALTVTPTNFVFTFNRLDDSETDTTQTFQYGTTLGLWSDVVIGSASSGPDLNGVTVDVVENGASADGITVTVPKGSNTKLFGRLQAVKIP